MNVSNSNSKNEQLVLLNKYNNRLAEIIDRLTILYKKSDACLNENDQILKTNKVLSNAANNVFNLNNIEVEKNNIEMDILLNEANEIKELFEKELLTFN